MTREITQIRKAIQAEIRTQRQKLDRTDVRVEDVRLVRQAGNGYIYQLCLARSVNLSSDQLITLVRTDRPGRSIERESELSIKAPVVNLSVWINTNGNTWP